MQCRPPSFPTPNCPACVATAAAWCGECDQATRMLGFDGDAAALPLL